MKKISVRNDEERESKKESKVLAPRPPASPWSSGPAGGGTEPNKKNPLIGNLVTTWQPLGQKRGRWRAKELCLSAFLIGIWKRHKLLSTSMNRPKWKTFTSPVTGLTDRESELGAGDTEKTLYPT